ncbi:MAG: hypothetical protein ACXVRK_08845 [Gaiellaceae bacterium]
MAADEIIDALYGLQPEEFTRARDEAASELREAGDREHAELVKALRKPTAAAAAVNRLVREHRGEVEMFLRVAASLRDAQFAGEGDGAVAIQREREALDRLIRFGGDAVRQTLLAAAVDEDAARELLEGRLVRELEPRGFGTLLAHSRPTARKPVAAKRVPPEPKKPDDRAARAKLRVANEAVTAAEAQEQQAKRHWAQTKRELEKARAAAETAQRDLDRLYRR